MTLANLTKVRSEQHDTVDAICYRFYGTTRGVTEQVLAANPGLAELGPLLPHGTPVALPAIPQATQRVPTVNLWD